MSDIEIPKRGTARFVMEQLGKEIKSCRNYIRQIYECYVIEVGAETFTAHMLSVIGGDDGYQESDVEFCKSVIREEDLPRLTTDRYFYVTVRDGGLMEFDFPIWPPVTDEELRQADAWAQKIIELFVGTE